MDELKPIPRDPIFGAVSDGLRSTRGVLDYVPLPQFLGGGLGQLLIGKAPEEVNEWAYGNAPMRINPYAGRTAGYMPEFKSGRASQVADTVLLPAAEATALAKLGARGLRGAYNATERAVAAPTEAGRREFMGKTGALAGGALVAGAVPDGLRVMAKALDAPAEAGLGRAAAATAARTAARAAPAEFYAAYRALSNNAWSAGDAIRAQHRAEIQAMQKADHDAFFKSPEGQQFSRDAQAADDVGGYVPDWTDMRPDFPHMQRMMEVDEMASAAGDSVYKAEFAKMRKDPRFAGYKTPAELEDLAKADSLAGKNDLPTYWAEARKLGMLPDDEVTALLKRGGSYTDPVTGNTAFLDKRGNRQWRYQGGGSGSYNSGPYGWRDDVPF